MSASEIEDRATALAIQRLADGQAHLLERVVESAEAHKASAADQRISADKIEKAVATLAEHVDKNEKEIIGLKHKTNGWTIAQLVAVGILAYITYALQG